MAVSKERETRRKNTSREKRESQTKRKEGNKVYGIIAKDKPRIFERCLEPETFLYEMKEVKWARRKRRTGEVDVTENLETAS
ncbi:hypothetical protein RUM43_001334 [Polyplax serrata]|uniref:Uncharacterized protein n=1 Tax=Polyplax serrata TaxID=468196 RepID=A0AAN8SDP3_POLSC